MLKKNFHPLLLYFSFILFLQLQLLTSYDNHIEKYSNNIDLRTVFNVTNLAQTAVWLNEKELAVGRWDGTITIFYCEDSLVISQALVPPIKQGITMLEKINDFMFASSNGSSSIALWERVDKEYFLKNTYQYNNCFGSADSARFIKIGNRQILLSGHSEGYLLIWEFSNKTISLVSFINLQTDHFLDSPYKLSNIRSIQPWKNQIVVTASEDGDLCLVDVLKGTIIHRQKYNKDAKRGINHIFISRDYLLVANCSAGPLDPNLWLYRIKKDRFIYLDSKKLVTNKSLPQTFSFNVGSIFKKENVYFFCSTGEGLLWFGQIENESLQILNTKRVFPHVGANLAIHPSNNRIAAVSYDIYLLEISMD